jgi:hypothetical protein
MSKKKETMFKKPSVLFEGKIEPLINSTPFYMVVV